MVTSQSLPHHTATRTMMSGRAISSHRSTALLDLKLNSKRYIAHCRAALDRVRDRTGVRCGPLDHGNAPAKASDERISDHELLRYMAAAE